jgi:ribonuclease J
MEIFAIGGYSEIGKNMTAVRVGEEVIILDMGVWLEKITAYENGDALKLSREELLRIEAIPDDRLFFKKFGRKVKAILCTHAHLDHLGAIPKLAPRYKAPIIATPYTIEVLQRLSREKGVLPNKLIKLNPGSSYKISDGIEAEFIYATHSTPQTVMIALHTQEGTLLYANDFKFDEYPLLGKRTDYTRLRKLGKDGVLALISDTTRIGRESKTHSETIVRDMLKDILFWVENKGKAIFLTTFSSHIARINLVVDLTLEMGRRPILLGRSLANYVGAAESIGLVKISKRARICSYKKEIKSGLKEIEKVGRDNYLAIVTGNQGEPDSVLTRVADGRLPFEFLKEDQVIFACEVIPTPTNQANRAELERRLKNKQVRLFKDVHCSGHAAKEDHRDLLKIINPKHYLPCHGTLQKIACAIELARELGYRLGKDAHILQNGQELELS